MRMNKQDLSRNYFMLHGSLAKNGYDWWWHNFTGYHKETGEEEYCWITLHFEQRVVNMENIQNKKIDKMQPNGQTFGCCCVIQCILPPP